MFGKDSFGNSPFDKKLDDVLDGVDRVLDNGGNYSRPHANHDGPSSTLDVVQALYSQTLAAVLEIERVRQRPAQEETPQTPMADDFDGLRMAEDPESAWERTYGRVDAIVRAVLSEQLDDALDRALQRRDAPTADAALCTLPAGTFTLRPNDALVPMDTSYTGTATEIVQQMMRRNEDEFVSELDFINATSQRLAAAANRPSPAFHANDLDGVCHAFLQWLVDRRSYVFVS